MAVSAQVVPARAGVILAAFQSGKSASGGSRASGGDPIDKIKRVSAKRWFPRERGVILIDTDTLTHNSSGSRASGGDPNWYKFDAGYFKWFPRERG